MTKKLLVALLVAAIVTTIAAATAGAQTYGPLPPGPMNPCAGGCDAEYPTNYNPYEMWNTYGYPTHSGGCWWYDVEGVWWYMCPPDGNLYPYQ